MARLWLVLMIFLSTLSLRRATRNFAGNAATISDFYPRSPCGERRITDGSICFDSKISIHALLAESDREREPALSQSSAISIHALLAESDTTRKKKINPASHFYPRSPCGERQAPPYNLMIQHAISIHALLAESDSKSAQNSGALLRIWNKFYGDCIFMLTGKAVFYPFCPCFFHIFWCEGSGNFMIAFPSH